MPAETRCDCCDLPVASCGKAAEQAQRVHERAHRRWLVREGWFSAQYPVKCCGCGTWHQPGILIRRENFGVIADYRAYCCAPDMPGGVR